MPAKSPSPARLKKRSDFVRASKGRRAHSQAFSLQMIAQQGDGALGSRLGFTVTKKVGNSVVRNRIRRRLREAFRVAPALPLSLAHDYVIVARREALAISFGQLRHELARALTKIVPSRAQPRPHVPVTDQAQA